MQQRRYSIRVNGLPPGTAFTLDALVAHVNSLAAALASAGCSIIMITLPPIGEDLGSDVNTRVGFACTVLRPEYATGDYKVCIGVQSGQPLACCTREEQMVSTHNPAADWGAPWRRHVCAGKVQLSDLPWSPASAV